MEAQRRHMMQLCFAFIFAAEAAPPTMSRYRLRLARVAGQAYQLGVLRGGESRRRIEPPVRSLTPVRPCPRPRSK